MKDVFCGPRHDRLAVHGLWARPRGSRPRLSADGQQDEPASLMCRAPYWQNGDVWPTVTALKERLLGPVWFMSCYVSFPDSFQQISLPVPEGKVHRPREQQPG